MLSRLFSLLLVFACSACAVEDERNHVAPELPDAFHPSALASESSDVCRLLGPAVHSEGIYGTDLGYTAPLPGTDRLAVLFGDTWSEAGDACQYPITPADDLQATWPRQRPTDIANVCAQLEYTLDDGADPKSWRRIHLYEDEASRNAGTLIEMGGLRTPVTAWASSDGADGALYTLISRGDLAPCEATNDCPSGMLCSNDAAAGATPLGKCTQTLELSEDPIPQVCRGDDDCGPASTCNLDVSDMCVTQDAFTITHDGQTITPSWYRDDARLGAAQTMYVARAAWPDRLEDYVIEHRFVTRRFVNATARTIRHFDPADPTANDYRQGDHTLLLWGRPAFVSTGGVQSLPFLLYLPLAELRAGEFRPRFFAGYGDDGKPRWSDSEADAAPIYGTEASVQTDQNGAQVIEWREPEADYVNQTSVVYLEPLQRFVMLYGGDVPAWLVIDEDGEVQEPVHKAPAPGAIHQRSARHPWGRATLDDPEEHAWTSAEPVLTRQTAAPYLACGEGGQEELPGCTDQSDENNPLDLLATITGLASDEPSDTLDIAADCIEGSAALAVQTAASGDPIGRLYGTSIIEEWTEDVTNAVSDLAEGERAVDLYWNVSTWNPYQVVVMKTRLRGSPL
jgi:hypothetical protein